MTPSVARAHKAFTAVAVERAPETARRVWESTQADLFGRAVRGVKGTGTMDRSTARVLRQLVAAQATAAAETARATNEALVEVREEALDSVEDQIGEHESLESSPLGSAPVRARVLTARNVTVASAVALYLSRLAVETGARASAVLVDGTRRELPVARVLADMDEATRGRAGSVTRIARTEAAYAWNGVAQDAAQVMEPVWPGLRKRWTERINELTGKPLDDRVQIDSIVLHGQAVKPDGLFVMPPDDRLYKFQWLVGKQWEGPPNRPNDRCVLTMWRPGWAVKAWEWRGGRRVPL